MEEKPLPAQRLDFLRHDSGVRWQKKAPDQQCGQEPSAIAHRRPSYPLSGCVPAEPDSVSPGSGTVVRRKSRNKCKIVVDREGTARIGEH